MCFFLKENLNTIKSLKNDTFLVEDITKVSSVPIFNNFVKIRNTHEIGLMVYPGGVQNMNKRRVSHPHRFKFKGNSSYPSSSCLKNYR